MASPQNEQLLTAIKEKDIVSVESALDNGADPNAVVKQRQKPAISLAITMNHKLMVTLLADKGADINKPDNRGLTPLMYASLDDNRFEILKFLIDRGANKDLIDKEGLTALDHAARERAPKARRLLLSLYNMEGGGRRKRTRRTKRCKSGSRLNARTHRFRKTRLTI